MTLKKRGPPLGTQSTTALKVLIPTTRNRQDWFDENDPVIHALLKEKHHLLWAHQSDPSCLAKKAAFINLHSQIQTKLRSLQDTWLNAEADKIQGYADWHDTKWCNDALKSVYRSQFSGSFPVIAANLLTEKKQILERWAEHFDSVLNGPSTINDAAIECLPQAPVNLELDSPPTTEEVLKAIKQMFTGKARGLDAIPANVDKAGGPVLLF